jgi:hypothetical protein
MCWEIKGSQRRKLESKYLLYPHAYPRIDVSAIAEDRIDIGSAAHIPTIVVDLDADQHLTTIKKSQFSYLCHHIPINMPEVQLLLSSKQPARQTRRLSAATPDLLIC